MDIWNKSKEPKETVSYMVEEITHICRKIGRRSPGSTGERAAAEYFAGVLEKKCGCTDVKTESFEENPDSFYGYFYFSAFCDILCGVFFFSRPLLSIFFGLLGVLLFVYHFVLYRKPLDPLFPRKQGTNVTAVRPCSGEVKQRIFLNGHTDAAWEFPINYRFGGIAFEIPGLAATVGVFYYIILSFLSLCGVDVYTAGLRGLVFLPFFLLLTITYNPLRVVDGANDNLTGCLMGVALLKEMEEQGIQLENTEIGVILTGSEEAGLRGAKAWCEAHKDDYRDVPTCIISYDSIYNPDWLMVNRRDLNNTVASDEDLCDYFLLAAEDAGVPCRDGKVPLFGGATDSAAFTQGGFRSIGITGLSHRLERFYHTRLDTPENLSPIALENCFRVTAEFVRSADRDLILVREDEPAEEVPEEVPEDMPEGDLPEGPFTDEPGEEAEGPRPDEETEE
ncbi:MAG: M20/M25/M40 family metallo-hydrolase [Clostridia bacterium]|nr:M20/M25/M40 family metallo-hydrolase [Clostridia bacterium]